MWAKPHGGRHQNIRDSRKPGEKSFLTHLPLMQGVKPKKELLLDFPGVRK